MLLNEDTSRQVVLLGQYELVNQALAQILTKGGYTVAILQPSPSELEQPTLLTASCQSLLKQLDEPPAIVLFDENIVVGGLPMLASGLKRLLPATEMMLLSRSLTPFTVAVALENGVNGLVSLTDDLSSQLLELIYQLQCGHRALSETAINMYTIYLECQWNMRNITPCQLEVLAMMLDGYTISEIMETLGCSRQNVHQVLIRLRRHFAAADNADLLIRARAVWRYTGA